MKYLKIGVHEICALVLILAAFGLRFVLISLGWPLRNSDEGIIGIMGLHIAYQGAHPIFYYGQDYMGSLQAFVAAGLFQILGPSLFTLRLGVLLLFMLFLVSSYVLTRMLYSRGWALVTLLLLGAGSSYVLSRQLNAIGGYTETLLFAALLFVLTGWLVLSTPSSSPGIGSSGHQPIRFYLSGHFLRQLAYLAWGLITGLALWSDQLIIPVVALCGLVLGIFCWRDIFGFATQDRRSISRGRASVRQVPALFALIPGLLIGALPLIYFNIHAAPGHDSLTVLQQLRGSGGTSLPDLWRSFVNTAHISVPLMTGNPLCPVSELDYYSPTSPNTLRCTLERAWWGYGYLLLLVIALLVASWQLYGAWRHTRSEAAAMTAFEPTLRISALRLALVGSAVLTLLIYLTSKAPLTAPGIFARYLLCLLVATPAIFWPLWLGIQRMLIVKESGKVLARMWGGICSIALAVACAVLIFAASSIFREVPSVQATNARDLRLIQTLISTGTTHIYSDYWTCYNLDFLSNEQVICAVVKDDLQMGRNRYQPYWDIVSADPGAAYVFPVGSSQVDGGKIEQRIAASGKRYQRVLRDGYVFYIPEGGTR